MSAKADQEGETSVNTHVGARIRDRRKSIDLTQRELGDRVGISAQQIQKYEKGSNGVSAHIMHKIAEALETSPNHFYRGLRRSNVSGGVNEPEGGAFLYDEALTADEQELVGLITHINNTKAVHGLLNFLREMLEATKRPVA